MPLLPLVIMSSKGCDKVQKNTQAKPARRGTFHQRASPRPIRPISSANRAVWVMPRWAQMPLPALPNW